VLLVGEGDRTYMAQLASTVEAADPSELCFIRPSRNTGRSISSDDDEDGRSQPICKSPLETLPTCSEGGTLRSKHLICPPCSSASQSSSLR